MTTIITRLMTPSVGSAPGSPAAGGPPRTPASPAGPNSQGPLSPYSTRQLAPLSSRAATHSGPSQFEASHDVQLKKHRVQYCSLAEEKEIDFRAAHSKAMSLIPQLQKKFVLESEEIQHMAEEQVNKQLTRLSQLRQEYQLAMKEMQRKHIEGQQRRVAGTSLNLDPSSPDMQNSLSASASRYPTAPPSPNGRSPQPHASSVNGDGLAPISSSSTLNTAQFNQGSSGPQNAMTFTMPSSPPAAREFSNEFGRLEASHDKFLGRLGRNHDRCLDLRAEEVAAWEDNKEACLEALRTHHRTYSDLLAAKVKELEVFFSSSRSKLAAKQADLNAREDRLRRSLEDMIAQAVVKLRALLVEYLGREVPSSETALQELSGAHAKAQRSLWAELQALLEVHEGSLRELLPGHNAAVGELQAAFSLGLQGHEKVVSGVLTDYLAGLHMLQGQYDNAEAAHRATLASIRAEHLRQLQSVREGYLGEVAGLLEEYRARLAELKQQFLLRHDASLSEA